MFSFKDDDEQWLSLRYDLTAPLARYVAENYDKLPKPYRSYRAGWVFRNEKPGPGRYRQFMQFDADTVGAASPAADAEMCMMAADCLEALGIARGDYVVKVNNRKVLDGVMEAIGLGGRTTPGAGYGVARDRQARPARAGGRAGAARRRAQGRKRRLHQGRGACPDAIGRVHRLYTDARAGRQVDGINRGALATERVRSGTRRRGETRACGTAAKSSRSSRPARLRPDRIDRPLGRARPRILYRPRLRSRADLRGQDEAGRPVRFGSVGGGGRYDGLVARFRADPVPATGFSIGVSRLLAALRAINSPIVAAAEAPGPVVVLALDRDAKSMANYQRLVASLRAAGIAAELYLGEGRHERPAQICRQAQEPLRRHPGFKRTRRAGRAASDDPRSRSSAPSSPRATKDRADYLELRRRAQFTVA